LVLSPAEKEARILGVTELWGDIVAKRAWGWQKSDPWQRRLLKCQDRFIILNCSRQSGKSSTLAVKAVHKALTTPKALILFVAEQRQSNEDLRKCREIVSAYDEYLREKYDNKMLCQAITDNITSIEFDIGSRIIALPGNEKVRGYSAPTMVILDEASYLKDEVFVGIDPMLEVSQGQLILASTPNGTSGFFHTEWTNPRYTQFQIRWNECPRIDPESIRRKRLIYGEAYVKQEYETEFLDDISSLFSERALLKSMDETEAPFTEDMANIHKVLQGEVELI